MDIRVVELGITCQTATTIDRLVIDRVDDLPDCSAKLDQSNACNTRQLVQEVNLQHAIVCGERLA